MALTGVTQQQVGSQYTLALGFRDPTSTNTNMVGYVSKQGTELTEETDIQDTDRLVQVSSPNSTDRFTYYPKVSQGDWSGGERQLYYVDQTKYYQQNGGIDATKPGLLQLNALTQAASMTGLGNTNVTYASAVGNTYGMTMGISRTSPSNANVIQVSNFGTAFVSIAGQGSSEPTTLISDTGDGFLYASFPTGIWQVAWGLSPAAGTNVTTDVPVGHAGNKWMAYYAGKIYYFLTVSGQSQLKSVTTTILPATPNVETTMGTAEGLVYGMASGPDGVYFFMSNSTYPQFSRIWKWDGSTLTLITRVEGHVMDAITVGGAMYLLCDLDNTTFTSAVGTQSAVNYTLYSLIGSSLSVIDDLRNVDTNFQAKANGSPPLYGNLATDGRYLYVASPETVLNVYDLASTSLLVYEVADVTIGDTNNAHRVAVGASGAGIVQMEVGGAGTLKANLILGGVQNARATTGTLTSSYYDFATPSVVKAFRSFEIELVNPVPTGASVTVQYRLDNTAAYTSLPLIATGTNNLAGFFPDLTKGFRIQYQVTMTRGSSTQQSPVIRSWSTLANLGRVWKLTVECFRQQRLLNGGDDQQGAPASVNGIGWTGGVAQYLQANIENCYKLTAGKCTLFVPSPVLSAGTEQVNAVMQSFTKKSMRPGPYSNEGSAVDMEAEIELTLVEDL